MFERDRKGIRLLFLKLEMFISVNCKIEQKFRLNDKRIITKRVYPWRVHRTEAVSELLAAVKSSMSRFELELPLPHATKIELKSLRPKFHSIV